MYAELSHKHQLCFCPQVRPNVCDELNIRKTVCQLTKIERTFSRWPDNREQQCYSDLVMTDSSAAGRCADASATLNGWSFSTQPGYRRRPDLSSWGECKQDELACSEKSSFFLSLFFFNNPTEEAEDWFIPLLKPCFGGNSSLEVSLGDTEKDLLRFNNLTLSQWQLLWLFWNSKKAVSGATYRSQMWFQLPLWHPRLNDRPLDWVASGVRAVYRIAGPLLIEATIAVAKEREKYREREIECMRVSLKWTG